MKNNIHHFKYLTITQLPDGLKLKLNKEGKQKVEEDMADHKDQYDIWYDLFDDIIGDSEYIFHKDMGESGFGLTNAEGITDGYHYVGETRKMYDADFPKSANVYWYPNYQVKNPLEELYEDGSVFFTKAQQYSHGGTIGDTVFFQKGYGYWDVTKYPYGGDFKRFKGGEKGSLIKGTVKVGGEMRVRLEDGRTIVTDFRAIDLPKFEDKEAVFEKNKHLFIKGYAHGGTITSIFTKIKNWLNQPI